MSASPWSLVGYYPAAVTETVVPASSPTPTTPARVAYFCMEFGIHHQLTLYAGGLGVLAGDFMKAARDLQKPVLGIGLLWNEGYTRQIIGRDGRPRHRAVTTRREHFEPLDLELRVTIRDEHVPLKAYRLSGYPTAPLYLLEPALPRHSWITERLYGGGREHRVAQEIVLGIGGVRLLRALRKEVDVYHFNEGHAVFAAHELMRQERNAGSTFDEALAHVQRHLVFTTHTPVTAGNEFHDIEMLMTMGADAGLSRDELVELGGSPYSMTAAGLRFSRAANAVARLHGETARQMWRDVPGGAAIQGITNGVHVDTWQDARIRAATVPDKPAPVRRAELWDAHQAMKRRLIDEVRLVTGTELRLDGLLVGFARRAAAYKRADLIFGDVEHLDRMLDDGLQLVFAGKAHPHDMRGKDMVARLVIQARRRPGSVVFLPDYDMRLGAMMTRGCDVWLNNPRRPMEASGTSGMKAAMNGVPNLSILDGWWPEGCVHGKTGWQIGAGEGHADESEDELDTRDRDSLYRVLATEVMPRYDEDREAWIDMMEASIAMSRWRFSSQRMVQDYYAHLYEDAS